MGTRHRGHRSPAQPGLPAQRRRVHCCFGGVLHRPDGRRLLGHVLPGGRERDGRRGRRRRETTPAETTPAETTTTETTPAETTTTETTPAGGAEGDATAGKEVFASAGCGNCHTLADAGATATVGPNLDEAKPSADRVVERVTNGQGVMPPFKDQLDEQQIKDVAAYVSSVAGSSP